jgi:oligoribonuclease
MSDATPTLTKSDQNLIWLDCEMTGLDPETDRLIEIAVIVTGANLEPRIEGPVLVIHQSDEQLDRMDAWNKGTHGRSGLIDKVKASTVTEAEAEQQIAGVHGEIQPQERGADVRQHHRPGPALPGEVHAQAGGVLSLPQPGRQHAEGAGQALAARGVQRSFKKQQLHTALADVHESIDELVHYREHFLRLG